VSSGTPHDYARAKAILAGARNGSSRPSPSASKGPAWSGGARSQPGRSNSLQAHADSKATSQTPVDPSRDPRSRAPTRPSPVSLTAEVNASLQAHANAQRSAAPGDVDAVTVVLPKEVESQKDLPQASDHADVTVRLTRAEARALLQVLLAVEQTYDRLP
jgi:hypothetical protein